MGKVELPILVRAPTGDIYISNPIHIFMDWIGYGLDKPVMDWIGYG
jgi:hypothetical protein